MENRGERPGEGEGGNRWHPPPQLNCPPAASCRQAETVGHGPAEEGIEHKPAEIRIVKPALQTSEGHPEEQPTTPEEEEQWETTGDSAWGNQRGQQLTTAR